MIAHDVTGHGPPVLLLHAAVADRRMWDPQVPALAAAGYRVVRCDLHGFGESPMPVGRDDDARDVADLMDFLGCERFALVGASGGGRVALDVAARWPGRVTALALLCTAVAGHKRSVTLREFGDREDALLDAGDLDAATDLNVATWLGPEAGPEARASLRIMQRHAFAVQTAGTPQTAGAAPAAPHGQTTANTAPDKPVSVPCLLVSGAHDVPDFRQIAARLADEMPGARHVELDWAGHLPSMERPDEITRMLIDFLRDPAAG
ncbi:alpha/beta fold hydrolase [Mangrovihabitans endophyticus]|uniref:Alpha/beta hydrolase n=1 Tax=Mangrovihabitans endophyticus TaxID=1751298 RepID=A0A8J3FQI0_9ACTN|nr:alpha/beta hydrolase [Mangrovihabitans endophyticus]GGL07521.1 alpha/beta hydrolase [Mangrovihabitans endophyticus]